MSQYSTGGHGNGEGSSDSNDNNLTFIDTDLLDCCDCHEPLTQPIFQCINGHLTCSSCCGEVGNECSMCSRPMGHVSGRGIEKVLETVIVACDNAKYGCEKVVKYNQKSEHQKTCVFGPCVCPHTGCNFVHNYRKVTFHFRARHQFDGRPFKYDERIATSFRYEDDTLVLLALTDDKLFVINNKAEDQGNVITLHHNGPTSLSEEFPFVMSAHPHLGGRRSDRHLIRSKVESMQGSTVASPSNSLMVPLELFKPYGWLALEIRIGKIWVH